MSILLQIAIITLGISIWVLFMAFIWAVIIVLFKSLKREDDD